jgi:receptor-type tyrosine-protein phosphatase beta
VSDPYNPFTNSSIEDFTVGTENCDNKVGYCNGPLKPGAFYRFKVRAYTMRDQFSETNWSQPIQTDPDNTAVLVLASIIPILLIILAIVALFVLRSRLEKLF